MRARDLQLLVAAVFVSAFGDWLALTALALHLEETTDSGLAVAALLIALWGPLVVLAGPAGFLVDRLEPRRVLVVASAVQAVVALGLAFAEPFALLLVLTVALGAANAISQPAEFALVPSACARVEIGVANARVETARFLGFAAGPIVGGALAGAGGKQLPLLVDAVSFLAIAIVVAVLRLRPRPALDPAEEEPLGRAQDGIVFLLRDDLLRIVMLVAFASLLFMTASAPAEVFFAKDFLHVDDLAFGALWTAWFAGMVVGGLLIAPRVHDSALAGAALAAIVLQSVGVGLPTVWLVYAFAVSLAVVGGTAHGTKNVLVRTLMHRRVPHRLHGRAFAAYNGLRNAAEMVALVLGGVLVVTIGARWTLLLAGAIPAAAGLAGLAAYRRRRARGGAAVASETA